MADNNIDLTATFDTSNATESIKTFGADAEKSIDGVNNKVGALSKEISDSSKRKFNIDTNSANSALEGLTSKIALFGAGVAAYFSVSAISSFFSTIVSEAVDAENSLNQLNAALARNGQLSAETSKSMTDFATAMMQASIVDDDVITGQLAIAMNFTKSADQAQKLVEAAMNLSAAMGVDLGTAVEMLGKTLDGTAGRLNETVPALRGVSEEALKSGAAIQIVNEQFAGAAANEVNTYSGAIAKLTNNYGNFLASLGSIITQNPMVIQAIKELSNAFAETNESLGESQNQVNNFVTRGITALISGIRDLLPSVNALASFIKSLGFIFEAVVKGIMSFVDGLKLLGNAWLWLVGTMEGKKSALQGIDDALDRMRKRGDDLAKSLENIGKDAFSQLDLKKFDDALKRIQDAANKKPIEINTKLNDPKNKPKADTLVIDTETKPIEADIIPEIKGMFDTSGKGDDGLTDLQRRKAEFMQPFIDAGDWLSKLFGTEREPKEGDRTWENYIMPEGSVSKGITGDIIGGLFDPAIKALTLSVGELAWHISENLPKLLDSMFGAISSAISGMSKGAEGGTEAAKKLLGSITTTVGEFVGFLIGGTTGGAIGAGIGSILASTFELASMDPGQAKQKVAEFTDSFLNTISTISENLDVILPKIAEALPKIIVSLIKALPAVFAALTKAMRPLTKEIVKELPGIAQALIDLTFEFFRFIFEGTFNAMLGVVDGLKEYLWEKMQAAIPKVQDFAAVIIKGIDFLKNLISEAIRTISIANLKNAVNVALSDLGKSIINGLSNAAAEIANWGKFFAEFFSNIGMMLTNGFGGLFDGSFFKSFGDAVAGFFKQVFSTENSANFAMQVGSGLGKIFSKENILSMLQSLIDGIGRIFSKENLNAMAMALIDGINEIFAKIDPSKLISNVGGKGQGLIPDSVPVIGKYLAKGGVVPPGYPNDQYPAMLSSNEVVVPADTSGNLFSLINDLSNREKTTPIDSKETNELLKQMIALLANQQRTIEVKLERDTLAKAMVSLNKDNRRLA